MKNIKDQKMWNIDFNGYSEYVFGKTPVDLKDIIFSPNTKISLDQ